MTFYLAPNGSQSLDGTAEVMKFDSENDARTYVPDSLIYAVDVTFSGFEIVDLDEWGKVYEDPDNEPTEIRGSIFSPFSKDEVFIRKPGTHPGGNAWWIAPSVNVWRPVFEFADKSKEIER